ncbi:hypothetical protein BT96DRAFT_1021079 [Gymnopus androsaceus JB14]|uniref:DUF6534 domain-containing protein n=1 Tax=Gymnopus androsaceus JB14 TaxID=1447944 RepID=A0A6A4HGV7_9AGAR|nr:hypothetical protein BT96DRAFT_1021079 [Gymnopus androsaceus JB14]
MFTEEELLHSVKECARVFFMCTAVEYNITGVEDGSSSVTASPTSSSEFLPFSYTCISSYTGVWLQLYVLIVGSLETVNLAFHAWYLYDVFIHTLSGFEFHSPKSLLQVKYSRFAYTQASYLLRTPEPILIGVVTGSIQCFVAWKLRSFNSKIRWTYFPVICFAMVGIVSAILATAGAWPSSRTPKVTVVLWLGTETLSDGNLHDHETSTPFLTLSFVWQRRVPNSPEEPKQRLLELFFRYVLQSGLLATICVAMGLMSYIASPVGLDKAFVLPLSKVHAISLMSTLNSRTGVVFYNLSSQEKIPSTDAAESSGLMKNRRSLIQSKPKAEKNVVNPPHKHASRAVSPCS